MEKTLASSPFAFYFLLFTFYFLLSRQLILIRADDVTRFRADDQIRAHDADADLFADSAAGGLFKTANDETLVLNAIAAPEPSALGLLLPAGAMGAAVCY